MGAVPNRGSLMKSRELLATESPSFGPDAMKVMCWAFDEAWASIAGNYTDASAQGARLELAITILAHARDDSRDVEALQNAALKVMNDRDSTDVLAYAIRTSCYHSS